MPAKKKSAPKKEKSFEETLWDTANKLRGSVESSEYKHVVLSLIFLKFVSDKFEERRAELVAEGKEDYLDMVDWSGATETIRQGCPEGGRGGANQNGVAGFDSVHLHFVSVVLANGSMSTNTKGDCHARSASIMPKATLQSLTRQREIRQKLVENDLVDCVENQAHPLAA